MRELAMRPIDVGPLVEQRQDLGLLPVQDAVDRVAARAGVIESADGSAVLPSPRPTSVQLEHRTGPVQAPASIDRVPVASGVFSQSPSRPAYLLSATPQRQQRRPNGRTSWSRAVSPFAPPTAPNSSVRRTASLCQ